MIMRARLREISIITFWQISWIICLSKQHAQYVRYIYSLLSDEGDMFVGISMLLVGNILATDCWCFPSYIMLPYFSFTFRLCFIYVHIFSLLSRINCIPLFDALHTIHDYVHIRVHSKDWSIWIKVDKYCKVIWLFV